MAYQPDGKVLIGGDFSWAGGKLRNRIARLNADGSIDESFDPGTGANSWVVAIALQPDGKILIGGIFEQVFGVERISIARLNPNGSLDASFNAGSGATSMGFTSWVHTIAVQEDGKVLIGGDFDKVNGVERANIARLNPDGSVDTSFGAQGGPSGRVQDLALQEDGKVVIGGRFINVAGSPRNYFARLDTDGSLDTTFDPGSGANGWVQAVAVQPDGKVLIGGQFISVNGTTRNRIARLDAIGTVDISFNPGAGADNEVNDIAIQEDGKIVIAGGFAKVNVITISNLARFNTDGSLDTEFNTGSGPDNFLKAVVIQPDGKVLIRGVFNKVDGTTSNHIARINADGSLDTGFDTSSGPNGHVLSAAVQNDGKIVIGGNFTQVGTTGRNFVARLRANGLLDTSFDPKSGTDGLIEAVAIQDDGKVLIGGWFSHVYDGTTRKYVARLNSNGSLDTGFNANIDAVFLFGISAVALQPDGKVLIGGDFTQIDGTARSGIARLNSDGSLDNSFSPGSGANAWVKAVALQPDGKVLIGGYFTQVYDGTPRSGIARLNSDGSLDTSFDPGTGINTELYTVVEALAVQEDGKVLVGGNFTQFNNLGRNYIERLNADGSQDSAFNTGTGADGYVAALVVQPDDKLLVGGAFSKFAGVGRFGIVRLNADGSLDASFNPGTGASAAVRTLVPQVDGKVIVGGEFTHFDGTPVNYITRLNGATPPVFTSTPPASPLTYGTVISHTFSAPGFPTPWFQLASGSLPPGLAFQSSSGMLSGPLTTAGTYTFTITANNGVSPSASQEVTMEVERAATTTTITTHTPNPSSIGQAVNVNFSVTSTAGTPIGNITVSDGTFNCSGTVASGNCTIIFNTAGTKTLTATYLGDNNYNTSVSAGVSHSVNGSGGGVVFLHLPFIVR